MSDYYSNNGKSKNSASESDSLSFSFSSGNSSNNKTGAKANKNRNKRNRKKHRNSTIYYFVGDKHVSARIKDNEMAMYHSLNYNYNKYINTIEEIKFQREARENFLSLMANQNGRETMMQQQQRQQQQQQLSRRVMTQTHVARDGSNAIANMNMNRSMNSNENSKQNSKANRNTKSKSRSGFRHTTKNPNQHMRIANNYDKMPNYVGQRRPSYICENYNHHHKSQRRYSSSKSKQHSPHDINHMNDTVTTGKKNMNNENIKENIKENDITNVNGNININMNIDMNMNTSEQNDNIPFSESPDTVGTELKRMGSINNDMYNLNPNYNYNYNNSNRTPNQNGRMTSRSPLTSPRIDHFHHKAQQSQTDSNFAFNKDQTYQSHRNGMNLGKIDTNNVNNNVNYMNNMNQNNNAGQAGQSPLSLSPSSPSSHFGGQFFSHPYVPRWLMQRNMKAADKLLNYETPFLKEIRQSLEIWLKISVNNPSLIQNIDLCSFIKFRWFYPKYSRKFVNNIKNEHKDENDNNDESIVPTHGGMAFDESDKLTMSRDEYLKVLNRPVSLEDFTLLKVNPRLYFFLFCFVLFFVFLFCSVYNVLPCDYYDYYYYITQLIGDWKRSIW